MGVGRREGCGMDEEEKTGLAIDFLRCLASLPSLATTTTTQCGVKTIVESQIDIIRDVMRWV